MNRLTWKRGLDGYEDVGLRDGVTEGDAICRLADYEDTGLEPEEVSPQTAPAADGRRTLGSGSSRSSG